MKKSRIAKLALLGASTLALAGTLTTSTYAWYVSNKQASATGMYGYTAGSSSEGDISVSWDGIKWYKDLTDGSDGWGSAGNWTTAALEPLLLDGTTAGTISTFAGGDAALASTGQNKVLRFTMQIQNQGSTKQYITPTVTFHKPTGTTKYTMPVGHNDLTVGDQALVDARLALYMVVEESSVVQGVVAATVAASGADATLTDTNGARLIGEAHNLYNKIAASNAQLSSSQTTAPRTSTWSIFELDGNATKTFTFTVVLAGNDSDCINAMAEQQFTVDLKFSASDSAA